ncbi:hypothetical protein [Bradyrhizobium canariense]|uniref:hypothetical protein n=1 Tax=Bradyrhizobium canariense TaxID=255045 RepID=UPI001178A88A|nr:hypothetical protein [Bradyrhizobium canariense]
MAKNGTAFSDQTRVKARSTRTRDSMASKRRPMALDSDNFARAFRLEVAQASDLISRRGAGVLACFRG